MLRRWSRLRSMSCSEEPSAFSLTVAEVYEKLPVARWISPEAGRFYYRSDCLPSIRGSGLPGGFCFYRAGCGAYGCAVEAGPSGNILGFLPSFFRLPLGRGWTLSWIGCMKAMPRASVHRSVFAKSGLPPVLWEEGCRKASRNTSFPADCASVAITPASQTALHLAKTLQRKFQADGYDGPVKVSGFVWRPISTGQHICTGTRLAPRISTWARHTQTDVWIFCTERKPDCDQSIQIKASGVLILGRRRRKFPSELAKGEVDELYDFLLQS